MLHFLQEVALQGLSLRFRVLGSGTLHGGREEGVKCKGLGFRASGSVGLGRARCYEALRRIL